MIRKFQAPPLCADGNGTSIFVNPPCHREPSSFRANTPRREAVNTRPWNAIIGGLAGTIAMTLMMYGVAPMILGRPMDVAAMLGAMLGGSWILGMLMHLLNGIVIFPLLFAYVVAGVLPGPPWGRGILWGLILWLAQQIVVIPMMGGGLFSARAGGMMSVVASLVAHVVYGVLLGALAGSLLGARAAHA